MELKAANQAIYSEAEAGDFNNYFSPVSFWTPDYLGDSAWFGHTPFAFWLTEVLSPKTFVELGTHNGYSYFTFCQAAQRLGLDMRCYAIDTWEGDEHSGFYGEEVFQKVSNYHERYSSFSRLVRSTFDEALTHFHDGSIDLLHIDGRHFYDDIKHDFETWRPKLSDRSVVIFHDTNVRENHFGVFSFWRELRENHPHFEFLHDHGLGILGVGASLPDQLSSLFELYQDSKTTVTIREGYSRLGSSIRNQFLITQQNERLHELETHLRNHKEEIQRLKAQLAQASEETEPIKRKETQLLDKARTLQRELSGQPNGLQQVGVADSVSSRKKVIKPVIHLPADYSKERIGNRSSGKGK